MADLTINSVSAPLAVLGGSAFTINVNVTAAPDSFEDGSAYRLVVTVNGSAFNKSLPLKGHLQEAPWSTASTVIPFTVTAGAGLDLYSITAGVIEGPSGLDPDSVPTFGSFGPIIVV
jgi:hypothetical protein